MKNPDRVSESDDPQPMSDHRAPMRKASILDRLVYWTAVGFGTGLAPKAPGTAGTLVGIPLYLVMTDWLWWQYLAGISIAFFVGIWICGEVSRNTGMKDAPFIVWDEIVGYLIAMFAAPDGWIWVSVGFVLFRLFDIWKPWPINIIDRGIRGGLGIMLDDVVAGCYALLFIQGISFAIPQ